MSVAVVHNTAAEGRRALASGLTQARVLGTDLVVLHAFSGSPDPASEAKESAAVRDAVLAGLDEIGEPDAAWTLLSGQPDPDAVSTLLGLVEDAKAELLVVGSRHRSAVGKFLMGQSVQRLLLETSIPVLLVK